MNLMKLLIKKIANSEFCRSIRQCIKWRPATLIFPEFKESVSISDAFLWRTDNNFVTKFKFTDLLNFFFNDKNSIIEIFFYNNRNELILTKTLKNPKIVNEIIINKKMLNGIEGYGSFYIFHKSKSNDIVNEVIRNSCYSGYSLDGNLASYVHGNTPTIAKSIKNKKIYFNFSKSLLFGKSVYKIQNSFKDFDKTELCFINPMKKKLIMDINNIRIVLKENCTLIYKITNEGECSIKSNCSFIRPIIFNYKNEYIDVYHG